MTLPRHPKNTRLPRAARPVGWIVSLLLLSGCASSPPTAWYSIVPTADAPSSSTTPAGSFGLAVGRVSVPEEADRPQLVIRGGPGGLAVLDNDRWVEPLQAQLPRAIALVVSQRAPRAIVNAYPAAAGAPSQWRLTVEVQRFELQAAPQAQATLRLVWTLRATASTEVDPALRRTLNIRVPTAAGDASSAALVAAMAQAVRQASEEMAGELCRRTAC